MRPLLPAALIAAAVCPLAADSASAKPKPEKTTYVATIDCGKGPLEVVSGDHLFAPLVHRPSGRRFHPVAWDVVVGDTRIVERKRRKPRRTRTCSYEDHAAVGSVTVKRH